MEDVLDVLVVGVEKAIRKALSNVSTSLSALARDWKYPEENRRVAKVSGHRF